MHREEHDPEQREQPDEHHCDAETSSQKLDGFLPPVGLKDGRGEVEVPPEALTYVWRVTERREKTKINGSCNTHTHTNSTATYMYVYTIWQSL